MVNNLFEVLATIGATVDSIWGGEWEGPILFNDEKENSRLILVTAEDHKDFDRLLEEHPNPGQEVIQEFARNKLVEMAAQPIDPSDYI